MNNMGYAFPRYSPMTYLFNDVVIWLTDCGIVEELFEKNSPYRRVESQVVATFVSPFFFVSPILSSFYDLIFSDLKHIFKKRESSRGSHGHTSNLIFRWFGVVSSVFCLRKRSLPINFKAFQIMA